MTQKETYVTNYLKQHHWDKELALFPELLTALKQLPLENVTEILKAVEDGETLEEFGEIDWPYLLTRILSGTNMSPKVQISSEEFKVDRTRSFGTTNPQIVHKEFWKNQIKSNDSGFSAESDIVGIDNTGTSGSPVWSFHRFGRSLTYLSDCRWVFIAGEHEDGYDPDFCIYNDVTVFDPHGNITHFTYPRDVFPPTDFHTETLVGNAIWLIGNLGYPDDRQAGYTQVIRLNINDFSIEKIKTLGDHPGWICKHKASYSNGKITITDGTIYHPEECMLSDAYTLDLDNLTWEKSKTT